MLLIGELTGGKERIIALVPIMTKGGNYFSIFVLGAVMALTAIAAIWLLCGNIAPLKPRGAK